jgi:hypothetical protein
LPHIRQLRIVADRFLLGFAYSYAGGDRHHLTKENPLTCSQGRQLIDKTAEVIWNRGRDFSAVR